MASANCAVKTLGVVFPIVKLLGRDYKLQFGMLDKLCSDIILGLPFLQRHYEVNFIMGGPELPLRIPEQKHYASVAAAKVTAPPLFEYLSDDCKPIATRSRQYSRDDQRIISSEIKRMLKADIIEPSRSPWRA